MPNRTEIDHQIGSTVFAINLVSVPTTAVREAMSDLQDRIERIAPEGAIYRSPVDSLHTSIFQFVWARGNSNSNQEVPWSKVQGCVIEALDDAVSKTGSICLASSSLEVRQAAIILVFPLSPRIEDIREHISGFKELTELQNRRPRLQHVTLFRYRREVPLESLLATCQNLEARIPIWRIANVELIQEKVYPSLDRDLIRSFVVGDST